MPCVRDQRGRVDPLADRELVPSDHLIADDAENGARDSQADVRRVAVLDQLADALEPREGRARPNDYGDAHSSQVFGALQPIGVLLSRRTPRKAETKEHDGAGGYV